MKSFEEYWNDQKKNGFVPTFRDVASNAFEAGQQSKQAEVDELRKNLNNALKTIEIQQRFLDDADGANEITTSRVGELQNKIDEALKLLNLAYPESWAYCVDEAINILKGDQS